MLYAVLWYGMTKENLWDWNIWHAISMQYEISMLYYEISFLCYAKLYVVKDIIELTVTQLLDF